MQYRIYLIGVGNRIRAAESFSTANDVEAKEIATGLYGSCWTSFLSVELWRGDALVMRQISEHVRATEELKALIDKRQESIAQLEEALERSFECVRESRQMMAALGKLREERRATLN